MRRFLTFVGLAVLGYALLPTAAQAQVIIVERGRVYAPPPVIVTPSYYVAPSITYSSSYRPSYSYYPSTTTFYPQSAPVVVYSAPVVTYSAPAVLVPAPGYYETHTTYGYGIFRPRGWTTQTYYRP